MSADVTLVDYGGGNTGSMARALARVGAGVRVAARGAEAGDAGRLVLPGVGHFGAVMEALRERGLDGAVARHIRAGRPFLGVCVGLQVLLDESDEAPGVPGLGLIPGRVVRFQAAKVPQVGFNRVETVRDSRVLAPGYFYFVNSYHAVPADPSVVAATAEHGVRFTAALEVGALLAVQFHPEKSGSAGLALLHRWLSC